MKRKSYASICFQQIITALISRWMHILLKLSATEIKHLSKIIFRTSSILLLSLHTQCTNPIYDVCLAKWKPRKVKEATAVDSKLFCAAQRFMFVFRKIWISGDEMISVKRKECKVNWTSFGFSMGGRKDLRIKILLFCLNCWRHGDHEVADYVPLLVLLTKLQIYQLLNNCHAPLNTSFAYCCWHMLLLCAMSEENTTLQRLYDESSLAYAAAEVNTGQH